LRDVVAPAEALAETLQIDVVTEPQLRLADHLARSGHEAVRALAQQAERQVARLLAARDRLIDDQLLLLGEHPVRGARSVGSGTIAARQILGARGPDDRFLPGGVPPAHRDLSHLTRE